MLRKLRRALLVGAAAIGLFATSTIPAQANDPGLYGPNLFTIAGMSPGGFPGQCMRPTSGSWGARVVSAHTCDNTTNGFSWEQVSSTDSRGGAWFHIHYGTGCMVPNWIYSGAPVVISGPCTSSTDYKWYAWPLSSGLFELVNGTNTNLVLDLNQSTGQVELWTANYGQNQQWSD